MPRKRKQAASDEELGELHSLTVKLLIERIREGTATGPDLATARAILKDSGIQAVRTEDENNPLNNLADSLPEFDEDPPGTLPN